MRVERKIKLPKQWKHWVRSAGLGLGAPISKWHRSLDSWRYLKGHGHAWRINMYGELQCGDRLKDFDRWALSNNVYVDFSSIKSRDQFVSVVKQLVEFHERIFPEGSSIADDCNVLLSI